MIQLMCESVAQSFVSKDLDRSTWRSGLRPLRSFHVRVGAMTYPRSGLLAYIERKICPRNAAGCAPWDGASHIDRVNANTFVAAQTDSHREDASGQITDIEARPRNVRFTSRQCKKQFPLVDVVPIFTRGHERRMYRDHSVVARRRNVDAQLSPATC